MDLSKELVKSFAAAINPKKEAPDEKTLYGTAIVDGDNVYVRLDGSTINTPAIKTVEVEDQDRVVVMMKNHTLTITGNLTVPVDASAAAAQAAQDSARNAATAANEAKAMASDASEAAAAAQDSADQAIEDAAAAHDAATTAGEAAESAIRAANTANDNARIAKSAADTAQEASDQAIEDAAAAHQAADDAQDDADSAKESALAANRAANGALNQASVIEDVLDTVTWIAEHGEFTRTTDTTIDPDKVYFIKVGNNYEAVAEPVASDLNKYYNLIIDESMQNYISSHLALTNAGLWVTKDGNAYKILVSNTGIVIYDELGHEVSSFGEDIIFSSDRPQRIGGEDAYIEYYDSDNDGVPDSLRIVGANISMGDGTDLEDAVESAQSQIDLMITPSGSSSFVLTQTMIQAMTNQFVIKGSDNTTTVISGGKISANSIKTGDLATDAIKSNNYSYTSGKYSNNGTYLNLANGEFISKNFGIDSNGNAYFKGELTATKLTIAPGATFEGDTSQFKGDKGDPGESVASVTNYYLATSASSGVTRSTSGWTTAIQTMTATNQYLWNYEVVNGSKGTTLNTTDPVIIGRYGQNGGKGDAGRGITSIKEHYQVSSSNTTPPTSWSDSMVNTTTTNKYLWNYETITYTDGTTEDSTKRVIGTHGATGARGATWYAGTAITGTSTTPTIFSGSGITSAIVGDHYLNTSSQNVYRCTVAGAASVAKWVYEQNIKGTQGLPGDPGPGGATTYFHVKYSNDGGATFTGNSGEDPGSYIGTYSDQTEADSTSVSAYTWVKIEGDKVTASKSGTATTIKINGTEAARVYDGTNGLNNATVTLYRRGTSAPAKPNGNVTYTFATGAVSGSLNSWTKEIPSGTDPVWAIVATASSTGTTDTIGSGEWSDAVKVITNGTNGNPGYNQATIFLYQRAASAPSKPSAAVTYTFSSGALSSVPSGWSRTVPAANGNPCFVTTAVAIGTDTTASIAASAWSDVVKLVEDGADGKDGASFNWNLLLGTATPITWSAVFSSSGFSTKDCYKTITPVPSLFAVGDLVTISFDWQTDATGGNFHVECGNVTPYTWGNVVKAEGGRSSTSSYVDISSTNQSGHFIVTYRITDAQTGAAQGLQWFRIRVDGEDANGKTFTISNAKAERGPTASDWCTAESEVHGKDGLDGISASGLAMKVNYSQFAKQDDGECYFHGYNGNREEADVDGWVKWNGEQLTITKGMWINPNGVPPTNTPILHIFRTSTEPYHADVWWDSNLLRWMGYMYKSASDKTPNTKVSWTWNEATDCILATYMTTGSEAISGGQLFNPPKKFSEISNPSDLFKIGVTPGNSGNMLLDTYARDNTKVNAKYNRYFSDSGSTSTVCSYVAAGNEVLPDPNAKYFVRIKNTEVNKYKSLCFYSSNNYENAVGMVAGDTYKVSCWVRQLEGDSNFCINLGGKNGYRYADATFVPTSEWQKYEKVFTFTDDIKASSTVWSRLYFYNRAGFEINGAGTGIGQIDMCGFKLERINAIAASGRNLCLRSANYNGWGTSGGTTFDGNVITFPAVTSNVWRGAWQRVNLPYSVVRNQMITITFKVKGTAGQLLGMYAEMSLVASETSATQLKYVGKYHYTNATGDWQTVAMSVYINDYAFVSGTGSPDFENCYFNFRVGSMNTAHNGFQMKEVMVALGSDPCAWSPAPEDTTQYFWADDEGAHVTNVPNGTNVGYNSLLTSQALLFRLNQLILMQLTGTDIRFYQNGNERAIFGSNVELKNGNMLMRLASDILTFIIDGNERASFGETVELRSSPFIVDPTDEDWVPEWYKKENIFKIEPDKMSLELRRNPDTAEELTQRTDITAWGIAPVLIKQPTPEEGDIPITAEFILGDGVYAPGKTKLWWDPYNGEINNGVSWLDGECYVSGWVTGSGKELMFTIPLTLPITENTRIWLGSSRTDEDGSSYMELTVRQNGKYILGSASEGVEVIHNSATLFDDLEIWPSASGINVHYYRSSAMSNYTNNDTCGIKVVYSFALINADE